MKGLRAYGVMMVAVLVCGGGDAGIPVETDWGPFYARWTDVNENLRTRAGGPIYEHAVTPEGWEFHSFRPFHTVWSHEEHQVVRREVLWPVARSSRREQMSSWRFLQTYGVNWDVEDRESRYRMWSLPFYFQGRSAKDETYRALFPIGGEIHEILFWDEIRFVLFPLRVESRRKEIEASAWLWPIFSRTRGPGVKRGRVFPFYGYNEHEGIGRRTFVMWPFWTTVRYEIEGSEGEGWILFPITGRLELEDQESWWILPPIFRWHRGERQNRLFGPWPFYQRESGEVDKFYLWPLYGTKSVGGVHRQFYLWPLGWRERVEGEAGVETEKRRSFFVPFYQRFGERDAESGELESRYTKLWPLGSHLYRAEGPTRRTVFPDLNPFRGGPIERNYASFWHLVVREQVGEAVDTEVLWGLYRSVKRGEERRHRSLFPLVSWGRGPEEREFSLLKGLMGYEREGEKKQWRFLYLFRFGDKEEGGREEPEDAL